jgi:DNA-binding CsgD family transcriptional regulator/ketosteroid isomerase-like protein
MSTPRATLEHWRDAVNSHDIDRLCALADPAIVLALPPTPVLPTGATFRGHSGVRTLHEAMFERSPDLKAEFADVRPGAGGLVVEVTWRADPREDAGHRVLVASGFRDGLLSRLSAFPPTPRFGLQTWIVDVERVRRLTPREYEILGLLTDGLTANEVAGALNLSRYTVRTHVQNAKERLGVHTVTHAAAIVARAARLAD